MRQTDHSEPFLMDEEIRQARLRRLRNEIHREIEQTSDPQMRAQLQNQLKTLTENVYHDPF